MKTSLPKIGFIGFGHMGKAIFDALPDRRGVIVSNSRENRNLEIAETCDLVFLAVRPAQVDAVAAELKGCLASGQTLVSVVAGRRIAALRRAFGRSVGVVRVMPNLGLRVGEGMSAVCAAPNVRKETLAAVLSILDRAGKALVLPERHFDAVTALSGSGPAYFAYMLKVMAEGGEALGLPAKAARLLAEQTMFGTAKYLRETGDDLDAFVSSICTKGGTTAAGMVHLSRRPFADAVNRTLAAAARRAAELG